METRSAKRKKLLHHAENKPESTSTSTEEEEDRITDLPEAVLHQILFLLPIKSIAQTSVLSKRWNGLWSTFPDLDFTSVCLPDQNSIPRFSNLQNFGNVITQILSLRNKLSFIRTLRFRACLTFSGLNGVIRNAVRHHVQELDVEVATNDYFNFPRSVITSDSLRVLRLKSHYPGFRLPPSRIMKCGFKNLHTMALSLVILYQQPELLDLFTDSSFPLLKKLSLDACFGLKHLRISCRGLEQLSLESCFQLDKLEICCPKLDTLRVCNCFDAYSKSNWLKLDAPRLRVIRWAYNAITQNSLIADLNCLLEVSIGLLVHHKDLTAEMLQSISKFLSGLSHAQFLKIESQFVKMLSKNNYLATAFFRPFVNVKLLELHTNDIPGLASLFRSSPIIQRLVINILNEYQGERKVKTRMILAYNPRYYYTVFNLLYYIGNFYHVTFQQWNRDLWNLSSSGEERFWENQSEALRPFLQYLQFVKIIGFLEYEDDVSLVKFFLKHGRALQEVILRSGHSHSKCSLRREKIKSQMMGFSRASSNAKLVFE